MAGWRARDMSPGALAAGGAGAAERLAPAGSLRLEVAPPLGELLLCFQPELAARLRLPFLAPHNIRGVAEYVCHECGASFPEPDPLKLHLFLRCEPAEPARLRAAVAARLAEPSAFRRVAAGPADPAAGPAAEAAALAWAARLGAGHACLYCGKLYSRRYGLKIHLRTHTGYRPLRCSHCARAFADPSNLNKHVRLHAAARGAAGPHACARCGKRLARRRDLERHRRAHCAAAAPD